MRPDVGIASDALKPKRAILLTVALAVAVAIGFGLYADWGKIRAELGTFDWTLFPLALALTALNYLIRFGRWHVYLGRLGISVPLGRSFSIFVAGLTMTITPGKLGEVLKCGLLRRGFGVPVRRSAPVVLAERVTDASGVVVLAVIGGARTDHWVLLVIALAGVAAIVAVVHSPLLGRFAAFGEAPEAARKLLGGGLLAERHARVDDLALLVDLVSSGWKSVDDRIGSLERSFQAGEGAIVYRIEERRAETG